MYREYIYFTIVFFIIYMSLETDVEATREIEDNIPTFRINQIDNHPYIEWSTAILKDNLLHKTSFELLDERPSLLYNLSLGQQSYPIKENVVSGLHSLKIEQTTPNKGNAYFVTDSYESNQSLARFPDRKYVADDKYLMINMYVKTNNRAILTPSGQGGTADKQITLKEGLNSTVDFKFDKRTYIGLSYFYVTNPKVLAEYIKDQNVYIVSKKSDKGDYDYALIKSVNIKTGLVDTDEPFDRIFKEGEDVLMHRHINPVEFESRTIMNTNGQWERVSFTSKVDGLGVYNTLKRGFDFWLYTLSEGTTYIDDVTFGYATEVALFRDGESIYTGYLSQFHDITARDIAPPDTVKNLKMKKDNVDETLLLTWDISKDNGSTYAYKINSLNHKKEVSKISPTKKVTITDDFVRYKYIISKKQYDTPTTILDINELKINQNEYDGDYYMHIQAFDGEGNHSNVLSVQLKYLLEEEDIIEMSDTMELELPSIETFGTLPIKKYKYKTNISFGNDFFINNPYLEKDWILNLTVTQLQVKTFDGFIGEPYQLPIGSLILGKVTKLSSSTNYLPEILYQGDMVIDTNDAISIMKSNDSNKVGRFSFNFEHLTLIVDPTTMKIDKKNYPYEATPYESTLIWNLIVGP